MADKTQRGQWASLGWLALMDFTATDSQGVDYDYSKPSLTPPILFGAQHGWVQNSSGFWIPQTQLDGDGKSTCGPIGGWLRVGPAGGRTQPQWAPSPFLAQVQSVGPPLEVAVTKKADGTLSSDLSEVFQCTLLPGASTPSVNDYGFLIQPARLDAQDPIFVPQKGGGAAMIAFQIDSLVGSGVYNAHQIDPVTGAAIGGGITTARCQEMNLSNNVGVGTNVWCQAAISGGNTYYVFVLPMAPCI